MIDCLTETTQSLERLPMELIIEVCSYLNWRSLLALGLTCKKLLDISSDNRLWEPLRALYFPYTPDKTEDNHKTGFLKRYYMALHEIKTYGSLWGYQHQFYHDKAMMMAAVKLHDNALKLATETLRSDRDLVMTALQRNGEALQYANPVLQDDEKTVLFAINHGKNVLKWASDRLKSDKTIVLSSVQQYSFSLRYACEALKNDKDVVLRAIQGHGYALASASEALRNTKEIVLLAVQDSGYSLKWAGDRLRNDEDVIRVAIQRNPSAIEYAKIDGIRNWEKYRNFVLNWNERTADLTWEPELASYHLTIRVQRIFWCQKKLSDGREENYNQFFDWLAENPSISCLTIDCDFGGSPREVFKPLSKTLRINQNLKILTLKIDRELSSESVNYLSMGLIANKGLKSLYLSYENFDDEGYPYLAHALAKNNTLHSLAMLNFRRTQTKVKTSFLPGMKCLQHVLLSNSTLTDLNLRCNIIDLESVQMLSEALKTNTTLKTLNLESTRVSEEGAHYLAEALIVNTSLESLKLAGNSIRDKGLVSLSNALKKNRTLKTLALGSTKATNHGFFHLGETLKRTSTLTKLSFCHNPLSAEASGYLINGLNSNMSLSSLNLQQAYIGEDIKRVQQLCNTLKNNRMIVSLNLSYNNLNEKAAEYISGLLMHNNTLQELELWANSLGDEGVKAISQALKTNQSLKLLTLGHNELTKVGITHVSGALEINKSLRSITLSEDNLTTVELNTLLPSLRINIGLVDLRIIYHHAQYSREESRAFFEIHTALEENKKRVAFITSDQGLQNLIVYTFFRRERKHEPPDGSLMPPSVKQCAVISAAYLDQLKFFESCNPGICYYCLTIVHFFLAEASKYGWSHQQTEEKPIAASSSSTMH